MGEDRMKITDALDQLLRALTSQEDEQATAGAAAEASSPPDAAPATELAKPASWAERDAARAAIFAQTDAATPAAPSAPASARERWESAEAAARRELEAPSPSSESALPGWVRGLQERIGAAADAQIQAVEEIGPSAGDAAQLAVGGEVVLDGGSPVEAEATAASDEAEPAAVEQVEMSEYVSPGAVEEAVVLDETSPVTFEEQVPSSDVSPVAVESDSGVSEYSHAVQDHAGGAQYGAEAPLAAESAPPGEPVQPTGDDVALSGSDQFEFAHLEASANVVESLKLGFHLGSAVQRIASAAVLGRDGVAALREAVWFIDRYVALLERRPVGADIHLSSARLAEAGDAIAGLKALAAAMDARSAPASEPVGEPTGTVGEGDFRQPDTGWTA
jgi:hypothetical protein